MERPLMKTATLISIIIFGFSQGIFADEIPYKVEASSTLHENRNYDAFNTVKIDPSLAWCTDKYGKNDVWLNIIPAQPLVSGKIYKVSILPGYAKSDKLFSANARPKNSILFAETSKGDEVFSKVLEFKNKPNMQSFLLSPSHDVAKLRLLVTEIYSGSKYDDLCITEIKLNPVYDHHINYQEKNKIRENEISLLKKSIIKIDNGSFVSVVNLFRLSNSLYYKTAEGGEWLDELYLDYFVKNPKEYLFLLSRQEEDTQSMVEKALLSPVSDKYDTHILSNAISEAIAEGVPKDAYPALVKKYLGSK